MNLLEDFTDWLRQPKEWPSSRWSQGQSYTDTPSGMKGFQNSIEQKNYQAEPDSDFSRHLAPKGMFIDPMRDYNTLHYVPKEGLTGFFGQKGFQTPGEEKYQGGLWSNPHQAMDLLKLLEMMELKRQEQNQLQNRPPRIQM